MYRILKKTGWALLMLVASTLSYGLSSDKAATIHAKADQANLNQTTHTSTYQGHVELTQGTTLLLADKLIIQMDKANQVQQVTAYANPQTNILARYQTLPDGKKAPFIAEAELIYYYPNENKIVLLGHASAQQANNHIKGPQLIYLLDKQILTTATTNKQPITLILQPNSLARTPSQVKP